MKGRLGKGASYLATGFKLITRPEIRLYVAIPLLINSVIFTALIISTLLEFYSWIEAIMSWLPGFLDFLRWVIWPMVITFLLTIVMYTFTVIANIIASPFNGLLAEKTQELLTGQEVPGFETTGQALLSFPKSIGREVSKLAYYLPFALLGLILSVIPVVNTIAPIFWFLLASWMMAIQYCDYPVDIHQHHFCETKTLIRQQRLTSYGFGASVMLGTMIPLVNLLIMPAAVCGATAYWVDELSQHNNQSLRSIR